MFKILGLLLICCLFLMLACSEADTLGDEPPTEIVIEGSPTWENGIGELVELKCASCHQVPASSYTPHRTPEDLDLRYYQPSEGRGSHSLRFWIGDNTTEGILEKPLGVTRKMPLDYATPLTDREISYLKDWVSNNSPE